MWAAPPSQYYDMKKTVNAESPCYHIYGNKATFLSMFQLAEKVLMVLLVQTVHPLKHIHDCRNETNLL